MKCFVQRVEEVAAQYPQRIAFDDGTQSITYQQMEEEACKVYRYLRDHGIGSEQFVTIIMPKDIHFFSCMLGVGKAGAAYVLIEKGYPKERVSFIQGDVQSCLTLDEELFNKIVREVAPLGGHEKTQPHQAAYAVYTSGSTGNPKGVLHEYGNLDQCVSMEPERDDYPEFKFGFAASLNFVATQLFVIPAIVSAQTVFLVSGELMRNLRELHRMLVERRIQGMFFPPSYLRRYKEPSPYLHYVATGSAPVHDIYYPHGPEVHCTYGMSETGFFVFRCVLSRAYDTAPAGRPVLDIPLYLMSEDGTVVQGAGKGELCFNNEYVRGYINLPEQTSSAFRPAPWNRSLRLFHTGDIVRRDEDGLYFIEGRMDDMVKIDGNRIEPAEIELAIKRITGLDEVMAKGFVQKDRAYVAAYFLEGEARRKGLWDGRTLAIDRRALADCLPQYMLPTYYVPLDSFPVNANGKLTRKGLEAPRAEDAREPYAEPRTEAEKILCDAMARVLQVDRIGAEDDFFACGGDSLRAIELVSTCEQLDLSATDVYAHRTARGIAAHVGMLAGASPAIRFSDDAVHHDLEVGHPLLPGQLISIDYQSCMRFPASSNMTRLFLLRKDVDLNRLCRALNRAVLLHPALSTMIYQNEDGAYRQRYQKDFCKEIVIEELSRKDWEALKARGDQPFTLLNSPLFRCSLYKVDGDAWLWLSFNHVIGDGSSMKLLLNDIYELYVNEDAGVRRDTYFSLVAEFSRKQGSFAWRTAEAYYANLFQDELGTNIPLGLKADYESSGRASALYVETEPLPKVVGRDNAFYLTACALAECWFNDSAKSVVTWAYANRGDARRMAAAGFLVAPLPALLDVSHNTSPQHLLAQVAEQVEFGMAHTEYSFLQQKVGDVSPMMRFIFQKDILAPTKLDRLVLQTPDIACHAEVSGVIGVSVFDNTGDDHVRLAIHYSKDVYSEKSIRRFAQLYLRAVDYLSD